jgi:hypothetical protein
MSTKTSTQAQSGKSKVALESLKTQIGKSRVQFRTNRDFLGSSRIQNSSFRSVVGTSRVQLKTDQSNFGMSRVTANTSQSLSGSANIVLITNLCCWMFKYRIWGEDFSPVMQSVVVNASTANDAKTIFKTKYPNGEIQDVERINLLASVNG